MNSNRASFVFLSFAILFAGSAGGAEAYVFTLDGKPFKPYVYSAQSENPQAGDVMWLGRVPVTLGAQTRGNIITVENEQGYMLEVDGVKKWIAVNVDRRIKSGIKLALNPLNNLSDAEIRELWGLRLNHWDESLSEKFKHIDVERICMTVESSSASTNKAFAALPTALRYLDIDFSKETFSGMAAFSELRFLRIDGVKEPFDCALIKNSRKLQYLDLAGEKFVNTQHLSALTELQTLKLNWCTELEDIAFASNLRALRVLDISKTKVADLSPLSNLPELVEVNADQTAVATLTTPATFRKVHTFRKLRTLKVMSTLLTDDSVAQFAKSHPDCVVSHRWEKALKSTLAGATRLRVRTRGTCCRTESEEKTLFEELDAKEIQKVAEILEIDEASSGFHCMCCGEPTLEFYKGETLVASLGFHHGKSLRWPGGWPADGLMKGDCAEMLIDWLDDRGVAGPRNEAKAMRADKRAAERRFERSVEGLSDALRLALSQDRGDSRIFEEELKAEIPDPAEQVRILLRIYGTNEESWRRPGRIENICEEVLKRHTTEVLCPVIEAALLGNEKRLQRGAAWLWTSYFPLLENWMPRDLARLRNVVLHVLQQSSNSSQRHFALIKVSEWGRELYEAELAHALERGLSDPLADVRENAILIAGTLEHAASTPRLMRILNREESPIAHAPVLPAELDDEPLEVAVEKLTATEVLNAALALGYLRHVEAKSILEQRRGESPYYAVALALLGDMTQLPADVFTEKIKSDDLQSAAVDAIVRSNGTVGLELAINGKYFLKSVERKAASSLIAMLKKLKAPGSETLGAMRSLESLRKWHQAHGEQFSKNTPPR